MARTAPLHALPALCILLALVVAAPLAVLAQPVVQSVTPSGAAADSLTFDAVLSESGFALAAAVRRGTTVLSPANVAAAVDDINAVVLVVSAAQSPGPASATPTVTLSGLEENTEYDVYVAAIDAGEITLSSSATLVEATTLDVTPPSFVSGGAPAVSAVTTTVVGPAGPQGPQGPQGAQGPSGSPDTAAEVLAKLVTVDGPGSGLAAETCTLADASTTCALADDSTNLGGVSAAGYQLKADAVTAGAGLQKAGNELSVDSASLSIPWGGITGVPAQVSDLQNGVVAPFQALRVPVETDFAAVTSSCNGPEDHGSMIFLDTGAIGVFYVCVYDAGSGTGTLSFFSRAGTVPGSP